jgi:hypothetical protein
MGPIRRSTARPGQTRGGLTGRICIDCCALEHLSTFHHCTFFTRLSILKNGFKTSFFEYKTAVRFESRSAGLGSEDHARCFLWRAEKAIHSKGRRVNACAYIFHIHLDRRIYRRPCVFKDSHLLVLCVIDFLTESRAGLVSLRSRRKDEGHE